MKPDELFEEWSKLWTPPKRLPLSQWAEENFHTSAEYSASTGKLRLHAYQREPLDAFTDPRVSDIVLKTGTQVIKTLFIQVAMAYVAIEDPGPCLISQYKEADAEAFSKERLAPMIRDIPGLQKIPSLAAKSRTAGSTATYKEFPGGSWSLVGAGAAGNAARRSIRFYFGDEINKYETTKEGTFTDLADERTATFGTRAKRIYCCTPTTPDGLITRKYEASDQRQLWVPCGNCGELQLLKWAQVRWDNDVPQEQKPETAYYECIACKSHWDDIQRMAAVEAGRWIAARPFQGIAGFGGLSHLYSPYKKLSSMARKWLSIQADKSAEAQEDLRVFINTNLAEEWVEKGDAPDWQRLYDRRETHRPINLIPQAGLFVTAGGDVQRDRIEISVYAWGRCKESWLIDHVVLEGDTSRPEVWTKLTEFLSQTYHHESGVDMPMIRLAIDSGYATQEVYHWARHQAPGRVMVVKGSDHGSAIVGVPSAVDVSYQGKKINRGIRIWPVNSSALKAELYGWLKLDKPTDEAIALGAKYPPGFCHFPEMDEEFFRQLCAEQLITRLVRGYRKSEWVKIHARNEALDNRNYARAAASVFGLDRFGEQQWHQLEAHILDRIPRDTAQNGQAKPAEAAPEPVKPAEPQRERGGWIERRRNWLDR